MGRNPNCIALLQWLFQDWSTHVRRLWHVLCSLVAQDYAFMRKYS
ncbi:hypothetical protein D2E22_1216 [Bifidobacterium castoris]|uniref:Uncharacterized protein n=1 Tax=Bifidobacterium castoris TaxID=2306972 RepID=A0A430F6K7_9BIFI|nr:hypothetical protein D2E22_1216 [Bifidobacterium castoris]